MSRLLCVLLAACASLVGRPAWGQSSEIKYPATRRVEQVDVFHGRKVADPYRWLETDLRQSPEVAAWAEAQNAITSQFLKSYPARDRIRRRLEALWNHERYAPPVRAGSRYAYLKNDGLQNHAVLYLVETLDGQPRVLLDPNSWSPDGSVALAATSFSDDGKYLAYGVSESGTDWQTWRMIEVDSGKKLSDEIRWIKFSEPAWTHDGQGFYYAGYEAPKPGEEFHGLNLNQKVRFHQLGTPQSQDRVVYARGDHPDWSFTAHTTDDGRYLVIVARKADDEHFRVLVHDLSQKDPIPAELIPNFDNQNFFVGNVDKEFYFLTDRDAPRRRLVGIQLDRPEPENWREIVPQGDDTLVHVSLVGDRFVVASLHDASTRVRLYQRDGSAAGQIELPSIGTAIGFGGKQSDDETFFAFASYATPAQIFRYDFKTQQTSEFRSPKLPFNPADYRGEQVFISSKDGTRIPLFLSYKKGLKRDGHAPALLYGYGGFGISITPRFSATSLAWMEEGGVYAVATLRGGGEYGEAWHAAGTKRNKQNVFDDFIAAAEWLIAEKYTSTPKLAIQGGSNGGLLVAATMIQRPDLFGACISEVPVTDMLRFHHFTDGRFWVTDYGSADDPDEFQALAAYSPYHNVKPGSKFPPTLVMTADTDDRVVPMHSFKFIAALQRAQTSPAPVLLRLAKRGGHGAGKAVSSRIEEATDQFVFLHLALGLP